MKMKMKNKQKYLNYFKNLIQCENNEINKDTLNNKINNLSNAMNKIENDINEINANTIIYKKTLINFINVINDDNDMINLVDIYNFLKYCINDINKFCIYDNKM